METQIKINYQPTERVQLNCKDKSRAKQSFRDECNINNIIKRYQKTGIIEHYAKHQGEYGDFTSSTDYHENLIQIQKADDAFATLPSKIRTKFNNSPVEFLDFVHNPENGQELIDMGLAKARVSSETAEQPIPGDNPSEAPEPPETPENPAPVQ